MASMSESAARASRERLANLTPAQRAALLARARSAKRAAVPDRPGPANRAPLSASQRRMLFGELIDPAVVAAHAMSGVATIRGKLDLTRLQAAADQLAARHETLRCTFAMGEDGMTATIHPHGHLPVTDLSHLTSAQRWEQFAANSRTGFPAGHLPLARMWVAQEDDDHFTAQLVISHLVSDGYSTQVFFRDLVTLYEHGSAAGLPAIENQFGDFAAYELTRFTGDDPSLAWWKERLAGAPATTALPFDRKPGAARGIQADRIHFELPDDVVSTMRETAVAQSTTPFAVVLAAVSIVVSRWADQEDLVVGVPTANRSLPGSTDLIGPFLNTLALRAPVTQDDSFATVVARWGQTYRAATPHETCPFDAVVGSLPLQRIPGLPPLFQILLNVENERVAGAGDQAEGLSNLTSGHAEIPLSIRVLFGDRRAEGHIEYQTELYERATIEAFLEALVHVLRAGTARPATLISGLALVGGTHAEHILAGPASPVPEDERRPLVDSLLQLAAEHGDRQALRDGHGTDLTLRQVAAESARIAGLLLEAGTQPGDRVGIVMDRSADVVLSVIAAARVGAIAVMMDARQPSNRLQAICDDCQPRLLIVRPDGIADLPDGPWAVVDCSDEPAHRPDLFAVTAYCTDGYMIYTSGTTGTPKGVLVGHESLAALIAVMARDLPRPQNGEWLNVCSPAFDMSVPDYWLPLLTGNRLTIANTGQVTDGAALARLIDSTSVTFIAATATLWQALVTAGWAGQRNLVAVSAGEPLMRGLATWLLDHVGILVNGYGPTETTVYSHWKRVTTSDLLHEVLPVGGPIAGSLNLVLDQHLNPVPHGVPGQLWIGGDPVSHGYWRRDDLTKDRFRELVPGLGRFYNSGDIVRQDAEGQCIYLGRVDHQVKIRGFRIELGEVESIMATVPGVSEAAAVISGSGDARRLAAFVASELSVAQNSTATLASTVSETLRAAVPNYMVPSSIRVLAKLPLTTSGKVDRRSLTDLADSSFDTDLIDVDSGAPLDELDRQILQIWRDVLGQPQLSADQDFFQAGGHSLLATQLMLNVKQSCGIDVPLATLFNQQATARAMAQYIRLGGEGAEDEGAQLDLAADAWLDSSVRPGDLPHCDGRDPQHILVTGITGYLGTFLAASLLQASSSCTLYGLVRATTPAKATERIRDALARYGLWHEEYANRVVGIPGDLCKPRLGLLRPWWDHLAEWVDCIYHSGADVNFARPYVAMRDANVGAVREILALAATTKVKPVHHMSTIYVFDRFSHGDGVTYYEDLNPIQGLENTFGYSQSKWVGEQVAMEGRQRGLPVSIYRLGRVSGRTSDGACQTYDLLWNATKVGMTIGKVPVMQMPLDITPVDWAIDAIMALSKGEGREGHTYHVVNPHPVDAPRFAELVESCGYDTEHVSFEVWRRAVIDAGMSLGDETASALTPFLAGTLPLDNWPTGRLDAGNLERGLAGLELECPEIDETLMAKYMDYFVSIGFLPAPRNEKDRI